MYLNAITAEELRTRRISGWRSLAFQFAMLLAFVAIARGLESRLALLAAFFMLAAVVVSVGGWIAPFNGELMPLNGAGCLRMKSISETHIEIAALLRDINAQGRPVVLADLWQANTWIREREQAEERVACRHINGLVLDSAPRRNDQAEAQHASLTQPTRDEPCSPSNEPSDTQVLGALRDAEEHTLGGIPGRVYRKAFDERMGAIDHQQIEAQLRAKLEAGQIETGLFNVGLQYVVMDRVGSKDELTFAWFDEVKSIDHLVGA